MRNSIKSYLDEVCVHIHWEAAHTEIREELEGHIEELEQSYIAYGMEKQQAMEQAIKDMGSSEEIGCALDRQHRPQIEWTLIGCALLIVVFGFFLMLSGRANGFGSESVVHYTMNMLFGFAIAGVLMLTDYSRLLKHSFLLYGALAVFLFIGSIFDNQWVNGRICWNIGSLTLCMDQIVLLFAVPLTGVLVQYKDGGWVEIWKWIGLCSLAAMVSLNYAVISTTCVFLICMALLLGVAVCKNHFRGNKKVYLFGLVILTILLLILAFILMPPHLYDRITLPFFKAKEMGYAGGYSMIMANHWLEVSQLWGPSPELMEDHRLSSLPAAANEFALVGLIGSFGWIVGIALLAIIALFLWRMVRMTTRVKREYGVYLATCASIVLIVKFGMNILMNFGFFPFVGIGLPLVSQGGTDFLINMIFIGIVLSVWRRNRLSPFCPSEWNKVRYARSRVSLNDGILMIDFRDFIECLNWERRIRNRRK